MVEFLDMELGTWGICGYGGTMPCKQRVGYQLYWIFYYMEGWCANVEHLAHFQVQRLKWERNSHYLKRFQSRSVLGRKPDLCQSRVKILKDLEEIGNVVLQGAQTTRPPSLLRLTVSSESSPTTISSENSPKRLTELIKCCYPRNGLLQGKDKIKSNLGK